MISEPPTANTNSSELPERIPRCRCCCSLFIVVGTLPLTPWVATHGQNLRTLICLLCYLCLFCLIFDEGSHKLTCFVCLALFLLDSDCSHPQASNSNRDAHVYHHSSIYPAIVLDVILADVIFQLDVPRSSASLGMSENLGLPPQLRMGHVGATDGSESGNPWEGYDNDILYTSVSI